MTVERSYNLTLRIPETTSVWEESICINNNNIIIIMVLEPFVGPYPLYQFLDPIRSR
jgi:hypothetical protein